MKRNEKRSACNAPELTESDNHSSMADYITKKNHFQYDCGFCACELPIGGLRFVGIGACPRCYRLADRLINALREHAANYFNNLGVRK